MTEAFRVGVGNGGWVQVACADMKDLLHVRFSFDGKRLRISEIRLSARRGRDAPIATTLQAVSLARVESLVNAYFSDEVKARIDGPSPDLNALFEGLTGKPSRCVRTADREFRVTEGPTRGLTDEFLRSVKRAYEAAVARGERPNAAISNQLGIPLKTVQRWVYTARQRGIMQPAGRQGASG
ncbi:hypothetical protein [Lentzea atacamensis]|uniref:hypothetical protein n=1 Tax=Lentzea atacamensis TaxID=531938 RepID=UPI0011B61F75|nr:hypothetical protein [Lentzea atacamensis]